MKAIRTIVTAALTAAALAPVGAAEAQVGLLAPAPEQGISLEATRPHFKSFDLSAPTSIWYLSGRMPINARLGIVADIPLSHAGVEENSLFESETSTVLGNPYLGLEFRPRTGWMIEAGLRAPLTTADEASFADVIGFLGEPQRGEAFMIDAVPLIGAVTYAHSLGEAFEIRARGGVTAAIYTGDDEDEETSTFVDYGVFGNYAAGIARIGAGVSGRWFASNDQGSFSDNSFHQLAFTLDAPVGRVRPGLSLRLPLDDTLREVVDYSFGAYLQVPIR